MTKNKIFTVGFGLPGDEFEDVEFESDRTLLDADIILFEPSFGDADSYERHNGERLLDKDDSVRVKRCLTHWRSEITSALNAGKLVIVFLARPLEAFRYTGSTQDSGTGRSRVSRDIVTKVTSYEAVPFIKTVQAKSGTAIKVERDARFIAPYWAEFETYSPYEVTIGGEFSQVLLRPKSGDRVVGAAVMREVGALLFLPPLRYDEDDFFFTHPDTEEESWTEEALKFGKRLLAALGEIATSLKKAAQFTPAPSWTKDGKFQLASEDRLSAAIEQCVEAIQRLEAERTALESNRIDAGRLRGLLFEQGKPLEASILEALRIFGFNAQPYADGDSEFDCVFVGPEGRCLGEAEGKDTKAINIDKFSQLERNLQEDFHRDDVEAYAKGALFGNAYRLAPLEGREGFFTEKCLAAAKRVGIALVRTPDLFEPARYLQDNPQDREYAEKCRKAIFEAEGVVVVFPPVPLSQHE